MFLFTSAKHSPKYQFQAICLLLIGLLPTSFVSAQFSDVTLGTIGLPTGLSNSDVVWGDIDNDGDLDFIVSGKFGLTSVSTQIYKYNSGSGTFGSPTALSIQFQNSAMDFGDYDNDGDIDLLICGTDNSGIPRTKIFANSGNATGTFVEDIGASSNLHNVTQGSVDWGDYDNDGDLDILLTGKSGANRFSSIYENQGGGQFQEDITASNAISDVENGAAAWGDYDGDGDLDIALVGSTGTGGATRLYQNGGSAGFVFVPTGFPSSINITEGSVAWGDYDNDGRLDVLVTGDNGLAPITSVLHNNGNNTFTDISAGITGVKQGRGIWGDYDNDGWLDIVVVGNNGISETAEIYTGNLGTSFTLQSGPSGTLLGVDNGASAAFGDFNGDDKLDLLILGENGILGSFKLYENTNSGANTTPGTPNILSANQSGTSVVFNWEAPSSVSPILQKGLSYNLYIGTSAADDNVRPAMAKLSGAGEGYRRVVRIGGIKDTTWTIVGLPAGTYHWSVQAIDADFEGSPFDSDDTFTVISTTPTTSVFTDVTLTEFPGGTPSGLFDGEVNWGDYNGTVGLDFGMIGNVTGATFDVSVYENAGTGNFAIDNPSTLPITALGKSALGWADFNNDNRLDLIISGQFNASTNITRVYTANAGGTLVTGPVVSNTGVKGASLDFGDYDNDGDLDILQTGSATAGLVSRIFENRFIPDGILSFTEDASASADLTGVEFGDGKFGDYDGDGYLDIAITGASASGEITEVYRNNQNGGYTLEHVLTGFEKSSLDWGDANNDGFLDLVVAGDNGTGAPFTVIYQYISIGTFSDFIFSASIQGVMNGSVQWGDYNNDGFKDILISGDSAAFSSERITKVYQNNASPSILSFTLDASSSATLMNVNNGDAVWGDYNGDNKLDVIVTGQTNSAGNIGFRLFKNIDTNPNTTPGEPENLKATLSGYDVKLSWDPPSGHDPATVDGLTYAIYIGTPSGTKTDIRSPLSYIGGANDGIRKVAHVGELYHAQEFVIEGLAPGNYVWSVQTIDQDFEPSTWATEDPFSYEDPTFLVETPSQFPLTPAEGVKNAAMAWGDYTGDGYLDIVVSGTNENGVDVSTLYLFDSIPKYFVKDVNYSSEIPDVKNGSFDWGDYNRDGKLDLLVSGETSSGPIAHIYENLGGSFLSSSKIVLTGIQEGSAKWVDYDNDGDLDVFLLGDPVVGSSYVGQLLRNDGAGTFTDAGFTFEELTKAEQDWADYNNDGYLDLLISGEKTSGGPESQLYRNDGGTGFTAINISGLPNLENSCVAWGDYNADGWMDFVITGRNNSGSPFSQIWRNNAGTSFTNINAPLDAVSDGSADWGDYNNDGYKDLLLTGQNGTNPDDRSVFLYSYNSGTQNFIEETLASTAFANVNGGSAAAWGDYKKDGKLDVLIAGATGPSSSDVSLELYENIDAGSPTTPGVPTNLQDNIVGFDIVLSWDAPSNIPASIRKGLSYNVMIGNSPGAIDVNSPMSETTAGPLEGFRRIVHEGKAGDTTAWRLKNLPAGTYYWKVQAIDADFEASEFSSQASIPYSPPTFIDSTTAEFSTPPTGLSNGTLAWVDHDLDDDLDLFMSGMTNSGRASILYRNNGGNFTGSGVSITDLSETAAAWGDYNNDNAPDLLITGNDGTNSVTELYVNNGSGGFSVVATSLPDVTLGSVAWGDVDYDGNQDILIAGEASTGTICDIYRNTPSGFAPMNAGLTPIKNGRVAWVDFDNNGTQDVFITGTSSGGPVSHLFRNDGNNGFSFWSSINIAGFEFSDAAWADYDNDGFPDLMITGRGSLGAKTAKLFHNDGGTGMTEKFSFGGNGVENGSAIWGDYNNDGKVDIILSGLKGSGSGEPVTTVFRNVFPAPALFVEDSISALPLKPVINSALAFGDYDGNGKLDLALIGAAAANGSNPQFFLYNNVDPVINTPVAAPNGLSHSFSGDTVILSWTGTPGHSYNLYMGTAGSQGDIISPLSDLQNNPDGYRRIAQTGAVGYTSTWKIRNLSNDTYFWSVQAVDQGLEGSPFATEQSFPYTSPLFNNTTPIAFSTTPLGLSKGDIVLADYDGDNDLDIIAIGASGNTTAQSVIYKNSNGDFALDVSASSDLDELIFSDIDAGDMDGDGDMDLLLIGESAHNSVPGTGVVSSIIYINDGNGRFSESPLSDDLRDVTAGMGRWGDYDNDGDLDIFLTGLTDTGEDFAAIYRNDGTEFVRESFDKIIPVRFSSADWGDYDQDGDLDLVVVGRNGSQLQSNIYRNEGVRGGFTQLPISDASLTGVQEGTVEFGDYNNDGYLDIILSGDKSISTVDPITEIYAYNSSSGSFEIALGVSLTGVKAGKSSWGDVNDDGFADILLTGQTGPNNADRTTELYLNDQTGGFSEHVATSDAMEGTNEYGSFAWGDVSKDGKLDVVVMGRVTDSGLRRRMLLYGNIDINPNHVPGTPESLASLISADSVSLTWKEPLGYPVSEVDGLTYNLYVGTTKGGANPWPSLSNTANGFRRIVQKGNGGHRKNWSLRGLPAGKYYWSVQTIEPDYDGSAFALEDSFTYDPPHFVDVNTIVFPGNIPEGLDESSVAWGDYDNDNDLDFIAIGESNSQTYNVFVYKNEGQDGFVLDVSASAALEPLKSGDVAWGDYNNDGFLDIALTGESASGPFSDVYAGNGSTFFPSGQNIVNLTNSHVRWGDYDNDGDTDLLLSGEISGGGNETRLYENEGSGVFSPVNLPALNSAGSGAIDWVDINRDRRIDIAIANENGMVLLRNDGAGNFTNLTAAFSNNPQLTETSIDWGDVDNDGFPDLVLTGTSSTGTPETHVFHNQGDETFLALGSTNIFGVKDGDVAWGDYDDDGFQDIAMIGEVSNGNRTASVFKNNQDNTFTRISLASDPLTPVNGNASLAWGDYNRDGKLDLLLAGRSEDGPTNRTFAIYRNDQLTPNTSPGTPQNLTASVNGASLELVWDAPAGTSPTRENGLTYNLFIGSTDGGVEAISPLASIQGDATGYRRIAHAGNVGHRKSHFIDNLAEGNKYFIGVQTIDQDFEGSRFDTLSIVYNPPAFIDQTPIVFPGVSLGFENGAIELGDYDDDGDLDVLLSGEIAAGQYETSVYKNNNGVFTKDVDASNALIDVGESAVAWIDYDNDGDLDVLITGKDAADAPQTLLYENTTSGFQLDVEASNVLENVSQGSVDWADYDNDGDWDLMLSGINADLQPFTRLYRNDQNHKFVEQPNAFGSDAVGVYESSLAWGDYNQDGWMDIALSGNGGTGVGAITRIYKNKKDGSFSQVSPNLEPVVNGSLEWGELDNDGSLELLLTGQDPSSASFEAHTIVYQYDPISSLFKDVEANLVGVTTGTAKWGDYNEDGFMDVLVSGKFGQRDSAKTTRIYLNDLNGGLIEDIRTSGDLVNVDMAALAWGDYNRDRKLDIFISGKNLAGEGTFAVYRNIDPNSSTRPNVPVNLEHSILGATVTLSWNPPQGHDPASVDGITYALYLGVTDSLTKIQSPLSNVNNGFRQVVHIGQMNHSQEWTFNNLPNGTYTWGVQAIDQSLEGSNFAKAPEEFTFINPIPIIINSGFPTVYELGTDKEESFIEVETDSIISEVIVHYKGIASGDWLQQTVTSPTTQYTFDVTGSNIDEIGLEYVYEVIGKYGFNAYSDTFYTYIYHPNGLDVSGLVFGEDVTDYNIISVPLDLENSAISSVVEDDFGTYDIFEWRFWHYADATNTEYKSGLNDVSAGLGYWLITREQRSFNTGAGTTVQVHDRKPFVVSLTKGWNQIGNPYPFNIAWDDLEAANPDNWSLLGVPRLFSNGFRPESSGIVINQFGGAYIFAEEDMDLNIPVRKNENVNRLGRPDIQLTHLREPLNHARWEVNLNLKSEGLVYPLGGFGMNTDADSSKDQFDAMRVPRLPKYLDITFEHPEYFSPKFTKDIVPTAKSFVWEFNIGTNLDEEEVEISWDNSFFGNVAQQLILFDVEHQLIINMAEQNTYRSFSDKNSRPFRVYFGIESFIQEQLHPDHIQLGYAYPNPATDFVKLPFNLPKDASLYEVKMAIMNLNGEKVYEFTPQSFEHGFHELNWNAKDRMGNRVAAGIYLYQIEVIYGGNVWRDARKLIID